MSFFVVLALVSIIFALLIHALKYHYEYWTRRNVPHEKPLFLVGNAKGIGRSVHFRDINQRIYTRFKGSAPFVGIYYFIQKAALIIDLDLIKQILVKDFAAFHDRGIFHNVKDDPLTGHLLTLEGEQWRAMRHKLTPVFTSGKMKFMFPTVMDVAANLRSACRVEIGETSSGVVEMKEMCARYTTDVIGTCAFGIECNSLENPRAIFRERGRSIFGNPRHSQIIQAFMLTNPEWARKMHLKFFSNEVSDFFISVVKETVLTRVQHNINRNDFMDMLIEMMAKDQEAAAKGDGIDLSQGLTILQVAAQAFVFFIAGFDTSSTTMAFCLYELALNQDIQNRLRSENAEVLRKYDGLLTYEGMNEMHYLEKVLSETLRKYPVLPHLIRKAITDYHVPDTEHIIEAGTSIFIPTHAIHHDSELFPEPEKFDPSRFDDEVKEKRHTHAFLPFGDGPRHCIGMRFGKMQAKIGLFFLLHYYKFTKAPDTEEPIELSKKNFILTAKNGLKLNLECIN